MRRQFGPGFFAKRGEGRGLDVLANEFALEQRGGYDVNIGEISESGFAEKVMAPHDAFEAELRQSMGGYFQVAMSKSDAANVREFEAYAREGVAPSPELMGAFTQFKNWLTEIYRTARRLLGQGKELSPQTREVFDSLLLTEHERPAGERRHPRIVTLPHLPRISAR